MQGSVFLMSMSNCLMIIFKDTRNYQMNLMIKILNKLYFLKLGEKSLNCVDKSSDE
ncbi:Uncharacterised protein [Streptococcus equi subsp. equi]|nr:Uncharacterised protein [Streptococcus equi subsp. equi]SEO16220.1 hypothetical protein SAMN05421801_1231 [Streptococcus equi]CRR18192.1 Uncharacterised protein [Streptococcus equi subsp. equi]CRR21839.1 Uncharacterised protein [Streptococcus equi subsp. equi]CRR28368.1 Uncharacterised protein [Streptococcus equi subsp. equi]